MNLNPYVLVALILLGIASSAQYFFGTKKNKALAANFTGSLEKTLKPNHTNYVNIGGAIGYNFVYVLSGGLWTSAKGTITLSPRHSLLYFPVSRLLGLGDRFYINLFTKKKIRGEAHLIDRKVLRRARIDGIEEMSRGEAEAGGKTFILLWRGEDLSAELQKILEALPDPGRLRHFCAFPDNKTFYLYTVPRLGDVQKDVETVLSRLPSFLDSRKEE